MAIMDGSNVRRKKDGPSGPVGKVTKAGAAVAGLVMENPEWTPERVFVIFQGDNLGWYSVNELEETKDPCPYFNEI